MEFFHMKMKIKMQISNVMKDFPIILKDYK